MRAAGAERTRQGRNAAETAALDAGRLSLHYLRYRVTGEVAGAWGDLGCMGAMLTNLAHPTELPATQTFEAAARFEKAQSSERALLARGRGDLEIFRGGAVGTGPRGAVPTFSPAEIGVRWPLAPNRSLPSVSTAAFR